MDIYNDTIFYFCKVSNDLIKDLIFKPDFKLSMYLSLNNSLNYFVKEINFKFFNTIPSIFNYSGLTFTREQMKFE